MTVIVTRIVTVIMTVIVIVISRVNAEVSRLKVSRVNGLKGHLLQDTRLSGE